MTPRRDRAAPDLRGVGAPTATRSRASADASPSLAPGVDGALATGPAPAPRSNAAGVPERPVGERFEVMGCVGVRYGRGPRTMVGLHGWSGSRESFVPLLPHLPPQFSFYAFDLPGSGESAGFEAWSEAAVLERLEQVFDALGLRRIELLGVCGGMGFGSRLAARRPDTFSRLVLVDPFAYVPWYLALFTWPMLGAFFYWWTFANPLGRWLTNGALSGRRSRDTSLTDGFRRVRHRDNRGQLCALAESARHDLVELGRFEGPVDIVYGERTFAAVRRSCDLLLRPYPRARRHLVAGAGHLPMHEAPEELARIAFSRGAEPEGARR